MPLGPPGAILSILDLASQGQIDSLFIPPSFDLIERFARYWDLVRPPSGKCNMAYPFYHMQSEGSWRLVPTPGQEQERGERITSSMTRLQSVVLGAEIAPELFELISGNKSREELRAGRARTDER